MKKVIEKNSTIVKDKMYSYLGQTIRDQQFLSSEQRFDKYLRNSLLSKKNTRTESKVVIREPRKVLSSSFSSLERSRDTIV